MTELLKFNREQLRLVEHRRRQIERIFGDGFGVVVCVRRHADDELVVVMGVGRDINGLPKKIQDHFAGKTIDVYRDITTTN